MLSMEHNIKVGSYRLGLIDSVSISKSVENLADVASIVLPGSYANKTIDVEDKLKEGDSVSIRLGYGSNLQTEFKGFLKSIKSADGKITLECEDSIYLFHKEVSNKQYKDITVKQLLQAIVREVNPSFQVDCDYDYKYESFVTKGITAYDVLKKVQEETKANVYLSDNALHIHPKYLKITNALPVVYDFAVNVEQSKLEYKKADERQYLVEVEGFKADGSRVKATIGKPGGDKRSLKVFGVTDQASLMAKAKEELSSIVYEGFEGNFTGWLTPFVQPSYKIELRDRVYPEKTGVYYVVATDVKFSSQGGKRIVTIGKKVA